MQKASLSESSWRSRPPPCFSLARPLVRQLLGRHPAQLFVDRFEQLLGSAFVALIDLTEQPGEIRGVVRH